MGDELPQAAHSRTVNAMMSRRTEVMLRSVPVVPDVRRLLGMERLMHDRGKSGSTSAGRAWGTPLEGEESVILAVPPPPPASREKFRIALSDGGRSVCSEASVRQSKVISMLRDAAPSGKLRYPQLEQSDISSDASRFAILN